ncbi:MAG: PEP-CTERM sorting domain-containing protein [Scytonematopsis contorta HA4267-MV1]|jgi:hypothetical protein|nr:PEP-CTERM sorting domain-containing protein [Scytonematopsis contorta HA4267-MV1]
MLKNLLKNCLFTAATLAITVGIIETQPTHAATFSNITVSTFSGGDVGEGLDLDGNFTYAVNMRGDAVGFIRDANFTDDRVAGVEVKADFFIPNWHFAEYGDSLNDKKLEKVMQSIRWTDSPVDPESKDIKRTIRNENLEVDLKNLQVGRKYKGQLLFAESCCDRGFDIFAEGTKLVDDLYARRIQGIVDYSAKVHKGAFVSFEFTAEDDTLNILLGDKAPVYDNNPILNGLTLELLEEESKSVPEPATSGALAAVGIVAILHRKKRID